MPSERIALEIAAAARWAAPGFRSTRNSRSARDRLPLPWRRSISQFWRAGRGTLLRRSPALHPGLDLIPWHAFTAMFERSEAAGVLGQHVRRPGAGASVAHGFERWRQRLISGRKIGQQFRHAQPARRRTRFQQLSGLGIDLKIANLDSHVKILSDA